MALTSPVSLLVLEEFRLHVADVDGTVARILATSSRGIEPLIPLLTSVDDRRDVATIRALHAGEIPEPDGPQRVALDPLVSTWTVPKQYAARIAERSEDPPSSYRLAVTESGINAQGGAEQSLATDADGEASSHAIGLIWIGAPLGTRAGLVILIGTYRDAAGAPASQLGWPLPVGRALGIRVYESARD
jgi:hypothetical protein